MWLLDARDLSLHRITDRDLEPEPGADEPWCRYAILSHCWEPEEDEPTFDEYRAGRPLQTNKGIRKIDGCCRIAQSQGLHFVWADTCCIDKRSSAELQEAINSMYRYYEGAAVCYVYLRDVRQDDVGASFVHSKWFTRGWTLQELLAPTEIYFYDRDWKFLGDKPMLRTLISAASGIDEAVLTGARSLQDCSVAERFSWAAGRETSRIEDRAYSLLGIFDVNMTMLYGEGAKSFLRLQEEILKTWEDSSIFVWAGRQRYQPGLLAPSPDCFASFGDVRHIREPNQANLYTVINRRIHGYFQLFFHSPDTYIAVLPCFRKDSSGRSVRVGIFLQQLDDEDHWARASVSGEEVVQAGHFGETRKTEIYVPQGPLGSLRPEFYGYDRVIGFRLNESFLNRAYDNRPSTVKNGVWNSTPRVVSIPHGSKDVARVGSIQMEISGQSINAIWFGFDSSFDPVIYLTSKMGGIYSTTNNRSTSVEAFSYRLTTSGGRKRDTIQHDGPTIRNSHWSLCRTQPDGTVLAYSHPHITGFWALKVDRQGSVDVEIVLKDSPLSLGRLQVRRAVMDQYVVWDLIFTKAEEQARDAFGLHASANGLSSVEKAVDKKRSGFMSRLTGRVHDETPKGRQ